MEKQNSNSERNNLIKELVALLEKGHAHVSFNDAVKNIPFEDLGKRPNNLPYSIWQITEHIRLAQWDILDFSRNENYKELKWPDDYWPKEAAPENEAAWQNCIERINADLNTFIELLQDSGSDIFKPFPHGNGQTLLREALLIADHNSYHTGEIIILRRLLGNW
jgi:uncharacterized damage-inducible protein DinB